MEDLLPYLYVAAIYACFSVIGYYVFRFWVAPWAARRDHDRICVRLELDCKVDLTKSILSYTSKDFGIDLRYNLETDTLTVKDYDESSVPEGVPLVSFFCELPKQPIIWMMGTTSSPLLVPQSSHIAGAGLDAFLHNASLLPPQTSVAQPLAQHLPTVLIVTSFFLVGAYFGWQHKKRGLIALLQNNKAIWIRISASLKKKVQAEVDVVKVIAPTVWQQMLTHNHPLLPWSAGKAPPLARKG